ncbi:MAG TPA: outer membrane protein assembly factor BamE [Hyphomicrobium sp.]|jgi:outer membrane protein assembly factor BamE (lipoprotein component of BamABCDE complex)|nr:outer membrane protein assembly factor BamE [Hyphomicrobium sp.]
MRRETNARQCQSALRPADTAPPHDRPARRHVRMLALVAALALCGCEASVIKHGTQFHDGDLQQIQPGMSQEQVRMNLGTPATTAVVNNAQAYYYISSTQSQSAFFLPTENDRQVVAVYFSPGGTVERVANYGLQDGKVFDYVSRTTPAPGGHDDTILKMLFRNLGTKQIFGSDN